MIKTPKILTYGILFLALQCCGIDKEKDVMSVDIILDSVRNLKEEQLLYFSDFMQTNSHSRLYLSSKNPHGYINQLTYVNQQQNNTKIFEEATKHAQALNSNLVWWVPEFHSANVPDDFTLTEIGRYNIMLHQLTEKPSHMKSDIKIVKITNTHDVTAWAHTWGNAFGYQNLVSLYIEGICKKNLENHNTEFYAGYDNDKIVACGSLFFDSTHNTYGGLYNIGTDPNFQRRGIAKKMITTLIARAQEMKLNYLVLLASPSLEKLYQDCGFQTASFIEFYVLNKKIRHAGNAWRKKEKGE